MIDITSFVSPAAPLAMDIATYSFLNPQTYNNPIDARWGVTTFSGPNVYSDVAGGINKLLSAPTEIRQTSQALSLPAGIASTGFLLLAGVLAWKLLK